MINMLELQNKVLLPEAIVDYARMISDAYPANAMAIPFVGMKLLCRDTRAYGNPQRRMMELDQYCGQILNGTCCALRESNLGIPDGIWVITMPVPRTQIDQMISSIIDVLTKLNRIGISFSGMLEINISGLCKPYEVPTMLQSVTVPIEYEKYLIQPDSAFRLAKPYSLNENYTLFRTRWNVSNNSGVINATALRQFILIMSQLLASAFH